jgi:CheY-like chemotaxis protein
VEADRGQLEQVLLNLAVNARDAMPAGGRLTFETCNVDLDEEYVRLHPGVELGSYVQLEVSDTGQGMGAETIAHIFEPFFTTKQPGNGTGLGLATVHGIVTQSGGHIVVESEAGRGTTFRILLPRVAALALDRRRARHDEAAGGGETVLVVEDVPQLRALIVLFLKHAGYKVLEATDGEDALAKARAYDGQIHCLLTDVIMPRCSGRELADRLQAERGDAVVLYMSGYAAEAIGKRGVLGSETHFLQKPFNRADLLRKLRQALDTTVDPAESGLPPS